VSAKRAAAVLLACLCLAARADEPPAKGDAEQAARLELMKKQAAEYEVTLSDPQATRLSLHPEPLLRFSNPVGGVPDGIAVMWKEGERPAVVAQVFLVKDGLWVHECQSLASAGLSMRDHGQFRWQPAAAAADFRPLAGAPKAAGTAVNRLVQMKALAARFSAADDFRVRVGDRETNRYQLRLLATPVYRYADAKLGVNDGAVFAFVHGTDPELFVLLEHRGDGDRAGWYYSLVPMTCWAVTAKLDGAECWSVPERQGKTTPRDPYHVWVYGRDR
jgi:hypothetical protein